MWTDTTREKYERDGGRYASDLSDGEWRLIEPFLPAPARQGRPRKTALREVMNALLYMASSGCQWRLLPREFPPYSTVQGYFYRWRDDGLWATINHHLVMAAREAAGREARTPAAEAATGTPIESSLSRHTAVLVTPLRAKHSTDWRKSHCAISVT